MDTYRATFGLDAPSLTPWRADTLFGHLCWALVRKEGDAALTDLLGRYAAGEPPLLLSDGFPSGMLPRPTLPPPCATAASVAERAAGLRAAKEARSRRWLTFDEFRHVIEGTRGNPTGAESPSEPFYTLHNQIHRETGTTTGFDDDETGRLYPVSGEWLQAVDVYMRVRPDAQLPWRDLLNEIALSGYGKRKSVGYGCIRSLDIVPFNGFEPPTDADAFVSLSAFVPDASDPIEGFWNAEVKRGKLGEERASGPNPFKRPVLRLTAGSAFRTRAMPRLWYGRMLPGLSSAYPDAVDYGLAFAVGLRWPGNDAKGDR